MNTAPTNHPSAAIHVIHGMMEHSARYEEFTEWMSGRGIAVFATDLPGHGTAVQHEDELGHIEGGGGWEKIMAEVRKVQDHIRRQNPGLPVVMLGHSFGSAVARSFSQRYSRDYPLQGLVLSGAMQQPIALLYAGLGLIALQKAAYGSHLRSGLMIRLGYGQYSKHFSPKRTDFDWLSTDPAVVDAYVADPLCGFACTLGFYEHFFKALSQTWHSRNIQEMPSGMPILLMGGQLDPAIRFGKDTKALAKKYRQSGLKKAEIKLWENGRHEMLNELNKLEVWEYLSDWIRNNVMK